MLEEMCRDGKGSLLRKSLEASTTAQGSWVPRAILPEERWLDPDVSVLRVPDIS